MITEKPGAIRNIRVLVYALKGEYNSAKEMRNHLLDIVGVTERFPYRNPLNGQAVETRQLDVIGQPMKQKRKSSS